LHIPLLLRQNVILVYQIGLAAQDNVCGGDIIQLANLGYPRHVHDKRSNHRTENCESDEQLQERQAFLREPKSAYQALHNHFIAIFFAAGARVCGFRFLVSGFWFLAPGSWLLVSGFWRLASDGRLPATSNQ
jgi:hypothetical protein